MRPLLYGTGTGHLDIWHESVRLIVQLFIKILILSHLILILTSDFVLGVHLCVDVTLIDVMLMFTSFLPMFDLPRLSVLVFQVPIAKIKR